GGGQARRAWRAWRAWRAGRAGRALRPRRAGCAIRKVERLVRDVRERLVAARLDVALENARAAQAGDERRTDKLRAGGGRVQRVDHNRRQPSNEHIRQKAEDRKSVV